MILVKEIDSYYNESMENRINKFLATLKEEQFIGITFSTPSLCYITYKTDKAVYYKDEDDD